MASSDTGSLSLSYLLDTLSPFLKPTFEEYGITSFDQLPASEEELDLALRELGCTENDRHRILSVKRDPALLSVMQKKPDAAGAHMLRRRTDDEKAAAAAAAEAFAAEFLNAGLQDVGQQEPRDTSVVFCSFSSPLERGKKGSIHIETLGYLKILHDAGVVCTSINLSAGAVGVAARKLCDSQHLSPACERQLQAAAAADGAAAAPIWSKSEMEWVTSITVRQGGTLAKRLQESRRVVLVFDGYELRYGLPLEAFRDAAVAALADSGVDVTGSTRDGPRIICTVRAMADTSCVTRDHAAALQSAAAVWVPAVSSMAALCASGVPDHILRLLPEHCPYTAVSSNDKGPARGGGVGGGDRFTFVASVVGVDGNHFARKGLDVLLRAFSSAFDAQENRVRLLLHLASCTDAQALSAFMQSVGLSARIGTQVVIRVRGRPQWLRRRTRAPHPPAAPLLIGCFL